jgi:hypothetical protein
VVAHFARHCWHADCLDAERQQIVTRNVRDNNHATVHSNTFNHLASWHAACSILYAVKQQETTVQSFPIEVQQFITEARAALASVRGNISPDALALRCKVRGAICSRSEYFGVPAGWIADAIYRDQQ